MRAIIQISKFIIKNNPWYLLPLQFFRAFIYQCQKRLYGKTIVKKLFNNKKIYLFPHNPISSAFVYCQIPDKNEILSLRNLADQHSVFLDIGANVGAYSLMLADVVQDLYAFEAHPQTAQCCKMNFTLNNISQEKVLEIAVSADDKPKLFSNGTDGCPTNSIVESNQNAITVPAISLDAFISAKQFEAKTNFLLKIDVEGFEHEVLQGAVHFLKNYKVKGIIFETFSRQMPAIVTLLENLGFKLRHIGDNNMLATKD